MRWEVLRPTSMHVVVWIGRRRRKKTLCTWTNQAKPRAVQTLVVQHTGRWADGCTVYTQVHAGAGNTGVGLGWQLVLVGRVWHWFGGWRKQKGLAEVAYSHPESSMRSRTLDLHLTAEVSAPSCQRSVSAWASCGVPLLLPQAATRSRVEGQGRPIVPWPWPWQTLADSSMGAQWQKSQSTYATRQRSQCNGGRRPASGVGVPLRRPIRI